MITAQIPAGKLTVGDYILTLSAINRGGLEEVNRYFFQSSWPVVIPGFATVRDQSAGARQSDADVSSFETSRRSIRVNKPQSGCAIQPRPGPRAGSPRGVGAYRFGVGNGLRAQHEA